MARMNTYESARPEKGESIWVEYPAPLPEQEPILHTGTVWLQDGHDLVLMHLTDGRFLGVDLTRALWWGRG